MHNLRFEYERAGEAAQGPEVIISARAEDDFGRTWVHRAKWPWVYVEAGELEAAKELDGWIAALP